MEWQLKSQIIPQSVSELKQILLENRSITDHQTFFHPSHPMDFSDQDLGFDTKMLAQATSRIWQAIKNQELIIVFGDYDADGISATALLWQVLHGLGAQVLPFIPERQKHGYGISVVALQEIIAEHHPQLIITVDNGIVAHQAADFIEAQTGLEMIITDHHQPEEKLPSALAVVHSTQICGAGVAWVLARSLLLAQNHGQEDKTIKIEDYLDLCGIATIADQMPLVGVNRSFAFYGLQALQQTNRVGLQALYNQAQLDASQIDSYHVNFVIAPRINASGRIGQAVDSLRLLCTNDPLKAKQLAEHLATINTQRQELTEEALELAKQSANLWQDENLIVVASDKFHEGIIGLIAGKLVEDFYKPALVVAIDEKKAKGSARSVRGVNVTELIRNFQSDLINVGGHPMAAGFSLEVTKLENFTQKILEHARQQIGADLLHPSLKLDCLLSPELVGHHLIETINSFAPFGQKNPRPVFGFKNVKLLSVRTLGRDSNHLGLEIIEPEGVHPLRCVGWRFGSLAGHLEVGQTYDIAGKLDFNTWQNKTTPQLVIKDIVGF